MKEQNIHGNQDRSASSGLNIHSTSNSSNYDKIGNHSTCSDENHTAEGLCSPGLFVRVDDVSVAAISLPDHQM